MKMLKDNTVFTGSVKVYYHGNFVSFTQIIYTKWAFCLQNTEYELSHCESVLLVQRHNLQFTTQL